MEWVRFTDIWKLRFSGDRIVAKTRRSYKWELRCISAVFHIAIQSRVFHRKHPCWMSTFIFVRLGYYFLMVWPRCLRNRSNSAAHWSQHECISGRVWEDFFLVNSLEFVCQTWRQGVFVKWLLSAELQPNFVIFYKIFVLHKRLVYC